MKISQSQETAVWNRAALENGGPQPKAGDLALAALLLAHGYIMNGGVHHAIECLSQEELAAAIRGYSYFGLSAAGNLLKSVGGPPSASTGEPEDADAAYGHHIPDDDTLARAFEAVLRERKDEFAEVD